MFIHRADRFVRRIFLVDFLICISDRDNASGIIDEIDLQLADINRKNENPRGIRDMIILIVCDGSEWCDWRNKGVHRVPVSSPPGSFVPCFQHLLLIRRLFQLQFPHFIDSHGWCAGCYYARDVWDDWFTG
jgi:hypothetical protein